MFLNDDGSGEGVVVFQTDVAVLEGNFEHVGLRCVLKWRKRLRTVRILGLTSDEDSAFESGGLIAQD